MKIIILSLTVIMSANTANATLIPNKNDNRQSDLSLQLYPVTESCYYAYQDCEKRIIDELKRSSHFILYQADSFDSKPIAMAIENGAKNTKYAPEIFMLWGKLKSNFTASSVLSKGKVIRYIKFDNKRKNTKTIIIDGHTLLIEQNTDSGKKLTIYKNNPKLINPYITGVLKDRDRSLLVR